MKEGDKKRRNRKKGETKIGKRRKERKRKGKNDLM